LYHYNGSSPQQPCVLPIAPPYTQVFDAVRCTGVDMIIVNGVESAALSAHDRGLMYGDGVFRTLQLRRGTAVWWPRQYAKLAHDCQALKIDCPSEVELLQDLATIAAAAPDCVAKIIVTRGESARGYAMSKHAAVTRIVTSSALPRYPDRYFEEGVRVHMCRLRLALQPALAGIKHLNRLENVLARAEWRDPAVAEGLMCDAEDAVIGGTMSNLFLFGNGTLLTPDVTRCGIAGVMRDLVIELAATHGVAFATAVVGIDDLLAAEEVFLVNSVIGLWPVAALDRKSWKVGTVTTQFRRWINDAQHV
jgi:4-amino-4-deoxychorismate lyase